MRRWPSHQEMQCKLSRGQDLYRKGANTLVPIASEIKMKQTPEVTSVATVHDITFPATHLPTCQITHPFIISLSIHRLIDLPSTHQSVIYSPTHVSVYPLTHSPIYPSNHPSTHRFIYPSICPSIHPSMYPSGHILTHPPTVHFPHMSPPWGGDMERQAGMVTAFDALGPL